MIAVDWNKYAEQYDAIVHSKVNPAYGALVKIVNNFFQSMNLKEG